ncbi:MAG: PD-(D/E)XK nuclease family protein, partial [Magnetococcus sp. WYHC-3]
TLPALSPSALPSWLAPRVAHWAPAGGVFFVGFDTLEPSRAYLTAALQAAGIPVRELTPSVGCGRARRLRCQDAASGLALAALWARRHGEAARARGVPPPRLGVIVPDLAGQLPQVQRVFDSLFQPDAARRLHHPHEPMAVDISLGAPLGEAPVIHDALELLTWLATPLPLERVEVLLRSPFWGGGMAEQEPRAALALRLRRQGHVSLDAQTLCREAAEAPGCRELVRVLEQACAGVVRDAAPWCRWPQRFSQWLAWLGWPGDRGLDSVEFQTVEKWRTPLDDLCRLQQVLPGDVTLETALEALNRRVGAILFQPKGAAEPLVQVLGALEMVGETFDALWVANLSDDLWPPDPEPNPFLPLPFQRQHGFPRSSAERELAFARQLTQRWLGAAAEVLVSVPMWSGETRLEDSPLIAHLPEVDVATLLSDPWTSHEQALLAGAWLDRREDTPPPAMPSGGQGGGAALLRDQSQCPFRALARHRLQARHWPLPLPWPDAALRGEMFHDLLAGVWRSLGDSQSWEALSSPQRYVRVSAVAREVALRMEQHHPHQFPSRERHSLTHWLTGVALRWLDLELDVRRSLPFAIDFIEDHQELSAGPLKLAARIDRMDRLVSGGRLLLDYKSGGGSPGDWMGTERLREPQLPFYAASMDPPPDAVALGVLKAGKMRLIGLARPDHPLAEMTGMTALDTATWMPPNLPGWEGLLKHWRGLCTALGTAFAAGESATDPLPGACDYCELLPLCRRFPSGQDASDPSGQDASDLSAPEEGDDFVADIHSLRGVP